MAIQRKELRSHSYIIFGGTKGIGRLICDSLAERRAQFTVAARTKADLKAQKDSYRGQGCIINVVAADVRNEPQIKAVFAAHKRFFRKPADVIINCAAVQGPVGNAWGIDTAGFKETIDINLTGTFNVAKTAVKQLLRTRQGSIILFSGGGAAYGRSRFSPYAASKAAVVRLVETIAVELEEADSKNIIINAVAPGGVKTMMTEEIIKAGIKAGKPALAEAREIMRTGGTPPEALLKLIDFLSDTTKTGVLSGRLIHVREDYTLCASCSNTSYEAGKLRIVPLTT